MNGWKEVLSIFAVTISVGLLIGMLLLINSTKRSTESQQDPPRKSDASPIRTKQCASRSKASSTTVESAKLRRLMIRPKK